MKTSRRPRGEPDNMGNAPPCAFVPVAGGANPDGSGIVGRLHRTGPITFFYTGGLVAAARRPIEPEATWPAGAGCPELAADTGRRDGHLQESRTLFEATGSRISFPLPAGRPRGSVSRPGRTAGRAATVRPHRSPAPRPATGVARAGSRSPARCRPGIGLRPGRERPEFEAVVYALYAGLYESGY